MKDYEGKLWHEMHNGQIQIRTLNRADLDGALEVLDKSFFLKESVCNACGINLERNDPAREELRELCRQTAEDGVSLVAKDVFNHKIVAVSFNKIQCMPESNEEPFFIKFRKETYSPPAQGLMDFMIKVEEDTDIFELYKIDCCCELMFLATLPEWECKGIGRTLVQQTVELTRQLSKGIGLEHINSKFTAERPLAVTALFTSIPSQRLGETQGFEVINTVRYADYGNDDYIFDYRRINPMNKTCQHVILMI